jgi:hypothetical protein
VDADNPSISSPMTDVKDERPGKKLVWQIDMSALKKAFRTLMPTCRDASRLQSQALDQSLSLSKRFGLRLHLLVCKWCRRYGKQIRFLRQAAREHADEINDAAPLSLSQEARERLKESLRKEAK